MRYKFDVDCIEFTYDEYQYLYSLSRLITLTPTKNTFEMFNTPHGRASANSLWYVDASYGTYNVSTAFLCENFILIKLAHAAMDNYNAKFMHDLMEMLPQKEL